MSEPLEREERRIAALRKTLASFARASRRGAEASSSKDEDDAALEAEALKRVALALMSEDDDDEPSVAGLPIRGSAVPRR